MLRVVEEAARTDTGRQRHANEDSYFARPPVFVVADGMGGAQAGEVASRIAADSFDGGVGDGVPEQELAQVAREANRRIFELARSDSSRSGMGTTLTGALVADEEVTIVHVGDSRAYLFRNGELRRLTRDHSLVEELRRQGQLTSEEAEEHPQRSIITRALGPEPDVELDVHTHQARNGDVFLLCSDGLTGMVREDRLREILDTTESLRAAVDRLVREANERGGRDNITVVCFRLGGDDRGAGSEADQDTDEHPAQGLPAAGGRQGPGRDEEPGDQDLRQDDAVAAAGLRGDQTPAGAAREPRADRRSRPEGRPRGRGRRRLRLVFAGLLVAGVIVAAVIGARAGLRQVYFVGQDRGLVTLYRGLPYELPAGIHLYRTRYVSSVPVEELNSVERRRLLDHKLRSADDAADVVRRLERSRTR